MSNTTPADEATADHSSTADAASPPAPSADANANVECPLCGYNLRGLTEPRCPECGFTFTWDELLDPARRKHPYLFEHYPVLKIWPFFRTLLGGLRLFKFWSTLHPAQPSHPKRLVLYAILCALPLIIAASGQYAANAIGAMRTYAAERTAAAEDYCVAAGVSSIEALPKKLSNEFHTAYPDPLSWSVLRGHLQASAGTEGLVSLAVVLACMYLVFPTLLIFRWSMRKAKIRTIHVFRCVVYSLDVMVWGALLIGVVLIVPIWTGLGSVALPAMGSIGQLLIMIIAIFLPTPRLMVAYHGYLRFDRPAETVLAAQFIVFLIMINIWFIPEWYR